MKEGKTDLIEQYCRRDRKSTRLNSSHTVISYAVLCLKKRKGRRKGLCTLEAKTSKTVRRPSTVSAATNRSDCRVSMICTPSNFFFNGHGDHRDLHSFPTRRSSDLPARPRCRPPGWSRWRTPRPAGSGWSTDRKSTRLNSSHTVISYAVFCLKKQKKTFATPPWRPTTTNKSAKQP